MSHTRSCTGDEDVALIGAAEPVITHRRITSRSALIGVLAMEELQRHPDPGHFLMDCLPVRLGEHAVMVPAAREQEAIHFTVSTVLDIIPPKSRSVGGLEDLRDRFA